MDDAGILDAVDTPHPLTPPRPRTRWAAIVWGLALAVVAAAGLWVLLEPARRSGITDWAVGLTPLSLSAYAVLLVGGLALVTGLGGLARRLQVRRSRGRERSSS